jgi:uncharacterized phage protein (TIGR01671 family)
MREISFRGRRKDTGEWTFGYLFTIWEQAYILWGTTNGIPNMVEVIPETVGQYTELDDLNKKPIYEDDVVRAWSQGTMATGKVERRVDGLWIMFPAYQNKQFWGLCPNHCGETSVEVIGNIHEGVTE